MDDFLRLTMSSIEYGSGYLTAYAHANDFSGQSGAYIDLDKIAVFASALSAYPLSSENFPRFVAGYFTQHESGIKTMQEHIALLVYPVGMLGIVGVHVKLHLPPGRHDRSEDGFLVHLELFTSYQQLSNFSKELHHLAKGEFNEAILLSSAN